MNSIKFSNIIEQYNSNDLLSLGKAANEVKQVIHNGSDLITFVIDRNINYTNICSCKCKFCAFYKNKTDHDAFVLNYEEIKKKISELVKYNGTQVLIQGGLNEDLSFTYYLDIISKIKKDFPNVDIHSFSPAEIDFIAKNENISAKEVLQEFKSKGLSSLPGGGAEILVDKVRSRISPNKISSSRWLEVMEIAHNIGLKSTATMVYGFGESFEDILQHLLKIKELQNRTGGFTAFIPWSFAPENTEIANKVKFYETTAFDYLKIVSVSRIIFDNIKNIQVSWVTQGLNIAQIALYFGANDFGGTMLEENVVKAAGVDNKSSIEEILKTIKNVAYKPAQRNTAYEILKVYE